MLVVVFVLGLSIIMSGRHTLNMYSINYETSLPTNLSRHCHNFSYLCMWAGNLSHTSHLISHPDFAKIVVSSV